MKKYTLVWVDCWMSGSHQCILTKFCRIIKNEDETLQDAIERYLDDRNSVVLIFEGWPKMDGEKAESVVESPIIPIE